MKKIVKRRNCIIEKKNADIFFQKNSGINLHFIIRKK